MRININTRYLEKKTIGCHKQRFKEHRKITDDRNYRDWFWVKAKNENGCYVNLGKTSINMPKHMLGKKVRFKMEVIE